MKLVEQPPAGAAALPPTTQLLVAGGDARISLDTASGLNKYGCRAYPDPTLLSFGSSTASVISVQAHATADALRERLLMQARPDNLPALYQSELVRIRRELLESFGMNAADVEVVFAASGTDAHATAARALSHRCERPLTILMVDERETGNGVTSALQVRNAVVQSVGLRLEEGEPRPLAEIDAEIGARVEAAIASGHHVLLVMVDQSKTGLIAPGPDCVVELHRRYPGQMDVLVDACQMRLAPATLRAYFRQGFMIALTGSKFIGGPSFSAALLLPGEVALRLHLSGNEQMAAANFGLLLRWEAALTELRRFRAVPENSVTATLQSFACAVRDRLQHDTRFEPLPVPPLARGTFRSVQGWDAIQTIFPFLLYRTDAAGRRMPLDSREVQHIYQRLPEAAFTPADVAPGLRCQLGQPVACGTRQGVEVSALRLCISARQVVEVARGRPLDELIAEAMAALDKVAGLA
ncbi:MAG: hypothetical protein PHH47_06595 [Gallionella sp.]|nr:hypothetical protein [Gallionella sp.]MDD4945744.1 hypothetical protein [Gallionella sp.]